MNSKPPVVPRPWMGGGGKTRRQSALDFLAQLGLEAGDQGIGAQRGIFAFFPVFEDHVDGAGVGLVDLGQRVQAVHPDGVAHAGEFQRDLLDAFHDLAGRLGGESVGGLHGDEDVALVLDRDERLRALDEHEGGERQQARARG